MSYFEPVEQVWKEVSSIVEDEGFSLYELERTSFGIKVSISSKKEKLQSSSLPDQVESELEQFSEAGVKSSDCSKICKRLLSFFQVEGSNLGLGNSLEIEVSSPGVNRKLRLLDQFKSSIGHRIKVHFRDKEGLTKTYLGLLLRADEESLVVSQDGSEFSVDFKRIISAKRDFDFGVSRVKNNKSNRNLR